ncbi:Uncharacterised protein [Shigella sonnei]|nr:Uncharacterised protein [Shigella sonnei]CSE83196.1 Uncharacterised protein [Shigella sonnei]CSE89802.1 Uncharacterised protein [Shigella sonnei]CSF25068.1 Uncharacterised protein [Shigella sonnei]CSF87823.1 Uncharacterised protein [Shigella sonnei]
MGTDFHQAADNIPDHMMYKGIRFDIYHHIRTVTRDINMHNVAPRGSGLALHRTERGEIILAQQALRSPMHPFSVQRFVKMGYPFTQYRRAQPMIVDDVAITASRGAKSGMKIIRYSFNPTHGDVTR